MSASDTAYSVPSVPLPPPPKQDPLSTQQWSILVAIADTVIPALSRASNGNRLLQHPLRNEVYGAAVKRIQDLAKLGDDSDNLANAYLSESAAAEPEFKEAISSMVGYHMSDTAKSGLLFILSALK